MNKEITKKCQEEVIKNKDDVKKEITKLIKKEILEKRVETLKEPDIDNSLKEENLPVKENDELVFNEEKDIFTISKEENSKQIEESVKINLIGQEEKEIQVLESEAIKPVVEVVDDNEKSVLEEELTFIPNVFNDDTLFNKELFSEVFVSGLFIGVLVFLVWKYLLDSGMEVGVARGYIMALMVFIQNIHVLNCRSEDESFFKVHLKGNVLIPIVIVGSILLQVIVMESPLLSKMLKTVSIPFIDCVFLFVISLSILVVVEIYKYFKRCLKYN